MSVLQVEKPSWMTEDVDIFADAVGKFCEKELAPHVEAWEKAEIVDRDVWFKAGEAGLLCPSMPEQYGGGGGTFAHEAALIDQFGKKGITGFGASLHNAIVAPYIYHYGTEEQRQRWLPKMATGELVGAIAMTEPGTGSDLQNIKATAKLDGNEYVINGSKTFITNGQTANLIIVVCKTDPTAGAKGTSLILVETDEAEGFRRGRNLDKVGLKSQDTSELFFDNVRVPTSNLLGEEAGKGFIQLMQQLASERLQIGLQGVAMMEAAIEHTVAYVKERKAFGQAVMDFQNTQFKLAEAKTKTTVARVFVDYCTGLLLEGKLDAATASMAKYWVSDTQCEVVDECLQLHGGYGYMNEYPIARMYRDARVQKIYGGTNEIMKVLISRTL
ncbi:MAG: acyl-CoA dehydrogenase family protein [Alphaproteobacteria bacterium]|nr:acyl-CoA dehydrogenase family protein [Alphaproteobacteria bacterium]MBO6628777.1 acyl-CoA dehydrogenase family protein [Alphaproteobacteria bacterium]MDF1627341.1 acyl-CoA dehydrogenase family protein [Parvibaculaceae bacterium]|tara:strand:- start:229 stop:1386 length:1158 start_codon:yes stop_codon:yes gene_type:complete